ncbi:MAG: glycosyltransferase [Prevotella sp.]|nr:glycosyltransferase [Prevotella sp.]
MSNICIPKVSIRCFTYNQGTFIQQCLDGFVMQKTNFHFAAILVDDASTDNEPEVLWNFINNELDSSTIQKDETEDYIRVVALHKTNTHCIFIIIFLKYNHYSIKKNKRQYIMDLIEKSKYIAFCEGDDYWIDPHKLQRQVDFLENHPNYTACFHNALVKYENHLKDDKLMCNFKSGDFDTARIVEYWQLPFASLLIQTKIFDTDEYKQISTALGGGYSNFLAASRLGKTYGFSEAMSVYRKNDGGVSKTFKGHQDVVWDINFKYAYFFNDINSKKVFDKKAEKALVEKFLPQYFKRKEMGIKVVKVIRKYNKNIIYKAIIKYPIHKFKIFTVNAFNLLLGY